MVYEWAENLTFGETGTIRKYLVHNLDFSAQHVSWTIDKTAMIEIPIEKTLTGLILTFLAKPMLIDNLVPMQNINITINDYSVDFELSKNDFKEYFIYIDKQFIENQKTIKILFSIPGATGCDSDQRLLGLCLHSIKIEKLTLAHASDESINRNFCALPWMFITLAKNGLSYLCPRNPDPIENWFNNDLDTVWNSSKMVAFREAISHGYYPNKYCEECHLSGGCDTSFRKLSLTLELYMERLHEWCVANVKDKSVRKNADLFISMGFKLMELSHLKKHNRDSRQLFRQMNEYIDYFHQSQYKLPHLTKISLFLTEFDYYLNSYSTLTTKPLFRTVTLVDKCNCNCIHCLKSYTNDFGKEEQLPEKYLETALSDSEYLSFFMAGTEFLLYKHWKTALRYFKKADVKFELSTNGILLTKKRIRFIVDSDVIGIINVSLDGARERTVEYIRRNVSFEKVLCNINDLFTILLKKNKNILVSLSFVCMKQNIQEAEEFVCLCDKLRTVNNGEKYKRVAVVFQKLESYCVKEYSEFYRESFIDIFDPKHNSTLRSVGNVSEALGIDVFVNNIPIEDALQI